MKNDYLDHNPSAAATTPPPHLFPTLHPYFPNTTAATSSSPSPSTPTPALPPADGATIEVTRRPRGRPPGSKNKPKAPLVVNRDPDQGSFLVPPHVLEVPPRNDIVESVSTFCRRNGLSLLVLSASGSVATFSLRQPSPTPSSSISAVTFRGRFELLSLSAVFGTTKVGDGSVAVTVVGPQGQIIGGKVAGPLVAASPVVVVAASFNCPSFHRLGDNGEVPAEAEGGGAGAAEDDNAGVVSAAAAGYGAEGVFWGGGPRRQTSTF